MKAQDIDRQASLLGKGFQQVEQQRVQGYGDAKGLVGARQTAQTRERERLAKKYGEQHPRVQQADRQLAADARLLQAVHTQHARARNPAPALAAGAWQLSGRVTDRKGTALQGLTVSLFNTDAAWERPLGYVCTNADGYYHLVVNDSSLVTQYTGRALYVTVTDGSRQLCYRAGQPIYLSPNQSLSRAIVIDSGRCASPEGNPVVVIDAPTDGNGGGNVGQTGDVADQYLLSGYLKGTRSGKVEGLVVKAVFVNQDGQSELEKEAKTDAKGYYAIPYIAADFGAKPGALANIVIVVYDVTGDKLFVSDVYKDLPQIAEINVDLAG